MLCPGIVGTLLLLILIIILIVFAKKIAISVTIIKEASKLDITCFRNHFYILSLSLPLSRAMAYIPGVVFYPILTWTFLIITVIFFAAVAL